MNHWLIHAGVVPIALAVLLALAGCATIRQTETDIANLHKGEAVVGGIIARAEPIIYRAKKHFAAAKAVVGDGEGAVKVVEQKAADVVAQVKEIEPLFNPLWIALGAVGLGLAGALHEKWKRA